MENCYNWERNILKFADKNENKFNLKFKGDKTIVSGDSATGKTLICTLLSNISKDKNKSLKPYNADNVFILTDDNVEKLVDQKNKLIIIDRAEFILNDKIVDYINHDRENRYLLFLRKAMGIDLSPNHFAELKKDNKDNETVLEYLFDIKGWY
ncbi:MAG: hypothetical protein J6B26_05895 [Agathobacter sp.]|nr:hypothetical protein [Agathobacter sp.]MBQ2283782.1 hypothetical protein [Agathobacter sp.]